ncbi:MAG: hypothetical protein WC222_08250 [Parachlamydiales bacterium]
MQKTEDCSINLGKMRASGSYNHFFTLFNEWSKNAPNRQDFVEIVAMFTSLNLSSSVLPMQNSPPKALALTGMAPFALCGNPSLTSFFPISYNSHKDVHVYCCTRDFRI